MQTAKTILNQIGGNKFLVMTGAKDIVAIDNGIQFGFKGSRKANKCRIILNEKDLYNISFYKFNTKTFDCPEVNGIKDVFASDLKNTFTEFTGLYTSI